mmetsp:Transcript_4898/g.9714  ORF Transcript_4898/g.9714 Transcript_4898/m.9714 type:complete len:229 (+) Transcript_4898:142-828(+)
MRLQFSYLEVDLEGGAHGRLDVQHLDVLPVLLEERDQEVHGQLHVEGNIGGRHVHIGNGQRHAHNLLHLELDGGLDSLDLLLDVIVLVKHGGELTGLSQTGTQDTGDLLDESGGSQETIVLLGELLDELLVLVELLEVVHGHLVHAELVGLLAVLLVSEDADAGVRSGHDGQTESSGETFVSCGVVVLQGDLKLNGLGELSHLALLLGALVVHLLTLGECEEVCDRRG